MSETPATLRLGLAAGGLRQARRHPLLAGRAKRSRQSLMLLDTADRSLTAAGWLCLLRDDGTGQRQEAVPVSGRPANPAPSPAQEMETLAEGGAEIATVALTGGAAGITAQFIATSLRCHGREAGFEELLLQAAPDSATSLMPLAAALARDLPLQWPGGAPLAAAAARLDLIDPMPVRAGQLPLEIDRHARAIDAFCAVARHCLAQFDANLLPVLHNRRIEGVHQMRVGLRRLRSAIGIFRPILPYAITALLLAELCWLNGPLGKKRDLDVFISETLVPLEAAFPGPKGLKHLQTVLQDRRDAAQVALDSALRASRCAAWRIGVAHFLDSLDDLLAAEGDAAKIALATGPAQHFAAQVLRKRRKKANKLGKRQGELESEALHELRIRAKKLRYAAEFFRPFFRRKESRHFIGALTELQDRLGALNDAAVGAAMVKDVLGEPDQDAAAAALQGWFAGRQRLQLDRLSDAWEAFAELRPYWKDALAE